MECGTAWLAAFFAQVEVLKVTTEVVMSPRLKFFFGFAEKVPHIFQLVASLFGQAIVLVINPKENVMKHIIKAVAAIVIAAGSIGNAAAQYTATTMGNTTFIHGPTGTTTATTMGNTTFIYGPLFPR